VTRRTQDTGALALGSAVSGLLAYVLFVAITRALGAEAAAPVSVLWTYWAFAGAAFTFPLQHWITRTVVTDGEAAVRRAAPRVTLVVLAAALALGALAWVARDSLFHRSDAWFPAMIALVTLGSALIGVTRGGLGARGRFAAVALSLVAENGLRCLIVVVLLGSGVRSPVAHGLALVAGLLVVVLWPGALRYRRTPTAAPTGRGSTAVGPLASLTGAGLAQLVSQAVLTGGPVVLALAGGSAREVTSLFAALALFRAPYMLALGAMSQVTLRVTQLRLNGHVGLLRRLVRVVIATTAVGVVLAGLLVGWLGPPVLRLVFGATVDVASAHAAALAVGCTLAVANLLLMVVALAHDRPGAVARAWLLSAAAGAAALALLPAQDEVLSTVVCFVVAEAFASLTLLAVVVRVVRRSAREVGEPAPGGPRARA
jgi:O-antigen/teichoic acid export membrane protein